MKSIKPFILGMVTYAVAIPILESLTVLVQSFLEIPKGKCAIKVMKMNEKLAESQKEPERTYAIGFRAPDADEYYEEEEDDD